MTQREQFQKKMQEFQVPTTVHYPMTMPDQPWYKQHTVAKHDITQSRWAASHVISLPMYPDMDDKTQDIVIDAVKKSIEFSMKQN
jgi:UDP-2-acetamido-2-deoxy-ribo-hexuluronate aminotransferase